MNKLLTLFTNNYDTIKKNIINKYNITPDDADDLMQELYIIFHNKNIDTPITDDEYFFKYIYNTAYYTFIYKYSAFNKNKSNKEMLILDNDISYKNETLNKDLLIYDDTNERNEILQQIDILTKQLDNKIRCYLNRLEKKNITEWYKVQLFKKYYYGKKSYRDIGEETNIHYTYVHFVCKQLYKTISDKYKTEIKNIKHLLTLI